MAGIPQLSLLDKKNGTLTFEPQYSWESKTLSLIEPQKLSVLRPILEVTKSQTLHHCIDSGLSYIVDPSNANTRYTRTSIRNLMHHSRDQGLSLESDIQQIQHLSLSLRESYVDMIAELIEKVRIEHTPPHIQKRTQKYLQDKPEARVINVTPLKKVNRILAEETLSKIVKDLSSRSKHPRLPTIKLLYQMMLRGKSFKISNIMVSPVFGTKKSIYCLNTKK